MKLKDAPWKESYDKPRQCIKKQRHHFANKGPYGQSYGFSRSHVRMWELDHKEDWVPKNWCFWTVVLEKTLEGHLDCKEVKPVQTKGTRPWILIIRTEAEAPPDAKSQLIGKDSDAGKDWGQEKWVAEVEMVGWHHRLNEHGFEQTLGDGEGQGSQVCSSPRGCKNWAWLSNWTTATKANNLLHYFVGWHLGRLSLMVLLSVPWSADLV